jgi:hypothetical protein
MSWWRARPNPQPSDLKESNQALGYSLMRSAHREEFFTASSCGTRPSLSATAFRPEIPEQLIDIGEAKLLDYPRRGEFPFVRPRTVPILKLLPPLGRFPFYEWMSIPSSQTECSSPA